MHLSLRNLLLSATLYTVASTHHHLLQASSRKDKVRTFLAALQKKWKDEYFQKLCAVLESVDPRLMDELAIELGGENGKQVITEAIDLENGRIVFKEFGQERRLSELEKKRLHGLLNRKSQCTRDIWERLERLRGNSINRTYETSASMGRR